MHSIHLNVETQGVLTTTIHKYLEAMKAHINALARDAGKTSVTYKELADELYGACNE